MQVMAIGTLALCYNNHRVFTGKQLLSLVLLMCAAAIVSCNRAFLWDIDTSC